MQDQWLILVLLSLLAPCVTLIRRGRVISWWHFPLWLCSTGSIIALTLFFEPKISLPLSLAVMVLVNLCHRGRALQNSLDLSLLERGNSTEFWWNLIKIVAGCCAVHLSLIFLNQYLLSYKLKKLHIGNQKIHHLFHDYFILGEGPLMQGLSIAALVCLIGVCIPVMEEIAFRGFFQAWLNKWFRPRIVICIVSIVFAALHGLDQLLPKIVFGIFASSLTYRYASLAPAILMHILTNTGAVLVAAALAMSGQDEVFNQRNVERLIQVKKDADLANLVLKHDYQKDVKREKEIRKIYEPNLRKLMTEWGISDTEQQQALDICEKSEINYSNVLLSVMRDTPSKVEERRNSWRVKEWEKQRSLYYKLNRKEFRVALKLILGTDQRVRQFEDLASAAKKDFK